LSPVRAGKKQENLTAEIAESAEILKMFFPTPVVEQVSADSALCGKSSAVEAFWSRLVRVRGFKEVLGMGKTDSCLPCYQL
jgi:hypothetical protein